jgi:hypothetical protein
VEMGRAPQAYVCFNICTYAARFVLPMHCTLCVGGHTLNADNLSYTVPLPLGRRNQMCKIEVHIKANAYRITSPKVQFPQTSVSMHWEPPPVV